MHELDDFTWTGDLDDDCTAFGSGLILRAEKMDRKHWWWAVCTERQDKPGFAGDDIAASYDSEDGRARTGREARILAERAAYRHLATIWARG